MIRVLVLSPFGIPGGATQSICQAVSHLDKQGFSIDALVTGGEAQAIFASAINGQVFTVRGIPQFDNTQYSHYRGVRWFVLLREIIFIPFFLHSLLRLKGRYDIIHCNEITAIFSALLVAKVKRAKLLVHVRSVQRGTGFVSRAVNSILEKYADAVICIDEAVKRSLTSLSDVSIIHNCFDAKEVVPRSVDSIRKIAIVGALHPMKGVDVFVDAAAKLLKKYPDLHFYIVGGNIRNVSGVYLWVLKRLGLVFDYRKLLDSKIESLSIQHSVHMLGYCRDIKKFYSDVDLICFPSRLDAPGRPVLEASAYGIPSICAMRKPTNDVLVHGVNGLYIKNPDPAELAETIERLVNDPELVVSLSAGAVTLFSNRFTPQIAADKISSIYRSVYEEGK